MSITSMRMLDNSSAEIRWRLTGKLGMLPVDVAGEQWCLIARSLWDGIQQVWCRQTGVLRVDVAVSGGALWVP